MPTFTTTIEDTAPIIEYSSNWVAGTSEDDRYADKYSQSSFMVTSTDGASLSFSFYGNAIQIYGAKRPNHGNYQVELDGHVYPESSGDASDPGNFQVSLFSASALEDGDHTITLTNHGSSYLDVDFISWDATIGKDDDDLVLKSFQDSDPSFIYSPSSSWSNRPSKSGLFVGGSGHVTTGGGSVEFQFEGDGVAIYGPVGPEGGPYSAQVDGRQPKNFTTNKESYRPQMTLYYANHLGSGPHTVKLKPSASSPGSPGQMLAIDYAVVYTTGTIESLGSSHVNFNPATIAGVSVGATISFFLLVGAFIYIWRRFRHRRRWRSRRHRKEEIDPVVPRVDPFGYASVSAAGTTSNVHLSELKHPSTPSYLTPMSPSVRPSTLFLSDHASSGILNRYEVDTSGVSSVSFQSTSYAESSEGHRQLLHQVQSSHSRMSVQNGSDFSSPLRNGKAAIKSTSDDRRSSIEVLPEYSR